MTDTTNANGHGPRHLGPTREVPLVGYQPRHGAENRPRNGGPHLKADANKPVVWPLAGPSVDADPTRKVQALPPPRPYTPTPNVVVEPPMAPKDARRLEKWYLVAALVVAAVAAVVFVVVNVAGAL